MESAVQTIPPIIKPLTIPCQPSSPTETRITDESIKVIRVMPETGVRAYYGYGICRNSGKEKRDYGDGE